MASIRTTFVYLHRINQRAAVSLSFLSSFPNQTSSLSTRSQIAQHKLHPILTKAAALQSGNSAALRQQQTTIKQIKLALLERLTL